MKMGWMNGLASVAVLAFAAAAMACSKHAKQADGVALAKDVVKIAFPCTGAKVDQTDVVTVADKADATPSKYAGCHKKGSKNGSLRGQTTEGAAPDGIEAILASMPSMKYRIGDELTCCSKGAAAMALKADKPIQYVVGEKLFEKETDAMVALTGLLDERVAELKTIQYSVNGKCGRCPLSAKAIAKKANTQVAYVVGGTEFGDQAKAAKAVKLVSDAVANMMMTYKVGDSSYRCGKSASVKAGEAGKKMSFVVGSEATCCEVSAKLMLAKAKVRAAVEAAAAALSS